MEVAEPPRQATEAALSLRLFGPLKVTRGGQALDLPPSRKVRALLGYLAVAPHPVGRNRLADLLGDLPNDPRGEVRWCLSKLRALVDEPGQRRLRRARGRRALPQGRGADRAGPLNLRLNSCSPPGVPAPSNITSAP